MYDSECPLCNAYSQAFIKSGMLDENGRMDYKKMDSDFRSFVDVERARNEIALIDIHKKTVTYGIHSLFAIIGNSFPYLNFLFKNKYFQVFMTKIYSFISYNRRVIIGGKNPESTVGCVPDFSLKYRIYFLIFTVIVSSSILNKFSPILGNWWPIPHGWFQEVLLVSGQVIFQLLVLQVISSKISFNKRINYIGNLMAVSLIGSLLLLPAIIFNEIFPELPHAVNILWFSCVVVFMFFEHCKRVKYNNLPSSLSYTWILYRILVCSIFCF